jgi:two-component system, chemotaxis family, sensor kinase CheA
LLLPPEQLKHLLSLFLEDIDNQGAILTDALLSFERSGEKAPGAAERAEAFADMLRCAHNLKGGARGMGLAGIDVVFHEMESQIVDLRGRDATPGRSFVDLCRSAISGVREAVEARIGGYAAKANLDELVASLAQTAAPEVPAPPIEDEADEEFRREMLRLMLHDIERVGETMVDSLLVLERPEIAPGERDEAMSTIMRSTHRLKGGAGSVRLNDMAAICHVMETRFTELKRAAQAPEKRFVDLCREAVAAMRQAVADEVEGRKPGADLAALVKMLSAKGEAEHQPGPATNRPAAPAVKPAKPAASTPSATPATAPAVLAAPDRIGAAARGGQGQTLPVKIERLDRVASLADDLVVSRVGMSENYRQSRQLAAQIAAGARSWRQQYEGWKSGAARSDARALEALADAWVREMDAIETGSRDLQTNMRQSATTLERVSAALGREMRLMRLVPVRSLLRPAMLAGRDLANELGKDIEFVLEGEFAQIDRLLVERLRDPLTHLIRNAIDHGVESAAERRAAGKPAKAKIVLSAAPDGNAIVIRIEDDGRGIDPARVLAAAVAKGIVAQEESAALDDEARIRLILEPGFSTRDTVSHISGRGIGMDVVHTEIVGLNGSVGIHSEIGRGTRFALRVPGLLARDRGMRVSVAGSQFVLPMNSVERTLGFGLVDIFDVDGEVCIRVEGEAVPLRELSAVLGLEAPAAAAQRRDRWHALVLVHGRHRVALVVDDLGHEDEIVVKPLRAPLVSVANVRGATYNDQGGVLIVLDDASLARTAVARVPAARTRGALAGSRTQRAKRILVVDDTLATRTLEMNIVESKGYEAHGRANGRQALDCLQSDGAFDLVITDLQMPEMDGIELTRRIRRTTRLEHIPVVVVTSQGADDTRHRCMEAGASAYLVKSSFESQALLETIARLI